MLRRPELQVVSLSFLDLLCCAFGAVILLVLLLIPGSGNSQAVKRDWTVAVEKTRRISANCEDIRVTFYEEGMAVDKDANALPLSVIQQVRSDVRAQIVPIFPKWGVDSRLEGIRCKVFTRGASTTNLDNIAVYVTDGVRKIYDDRIQHISEE